MYVLETRSLRQDGDVQRYIDYLCNGLLLLCSRADWFVSSLATQLPPKAVRTMCMAMGSSSRLKQVHQEFQTRCPMMLCGESSLILSGKRATSGHENRKEMRLAMKGVILLMRC